MRILDTENYQSKRKKSHPSADLLREEILEHSKHFKTSWIQLGQALYSVWKGKLFYLWGYEKFEYYTREEVGLQKDLAVKLLKVYFFLEEQEPEYLQKDFQRERRPRQVPSYEDLNLLRLAKQNKELNLQDYLKFKRDIFEEGKAAALVKKDLTQLIRERTEVDSNDERQRRHRLSFQRLISAMKSFQKDMEALKLVSPVLLKEIEALKRKLVAEVEK